MELKQLCDLNPKSLWKKASQPNFASLILEEYCGIINAQVSGTWEAFAKPENKEKNRNNLVPCWDHTRVKLAAYESASDYIHANYVDGFQDKKKFICTQAPKTNTLVDFYQIVWNQNSCIIIMLVNVTSSCCQYWLSEEDGTLQVAQYIIRTLKKKTFSNYIVTELSVTHEFIERQRRVYHFLYIDWTEDGNFNDVGKFYKFVLTINHMRKVVQTKMLSCCEIIGPIIVHCCTEIGTAGVFCVIDYALHQLKKSAKISLPKILIGIRQQRHSSVVILDQYLFCYRVVLHFLAETNNRLRDKEKMGLLRTS
ncbi:GSCOCT00013381001.2-RA-CDS [Cotesia congregata]|uniref:Cc_ptp.w_14.6 n=2 Tax=root TaxID=1 RepID=S6CVV5_COTCN|nr:PTPW [Bracoviriform congregatae]CAD6244539.1 GSCOCT00013381001.2-RA-CDS [Cotesia congregata]CAG17449.1 PTPW [Bracoviriform congregatae]CAG26742.1 protein tyrosine phosphatase [Bracoviriform congregatae]CAG5075276.1 cc_ptp.w_14.6 [Cotesia congregata]CCQ71347.1 protein tyrosine phosphatase PTPW [Cotesia congregata]